MTHIVQVANFYAPTSGGLRTAVDALGRGYTARGVERTLVVPGARPGIHCGPEGRRITVPGRPLPGTPYRIMSSTLALRRLLDDLAPDRIEVHDKLHAVGVARWAERRGVPTVLVSHERLDAILAGRVPSWFPLRAATDRWNRRLADAFDLAVCASRYAAAEWEGIGMDVAVVPLGVDLDTFHPGAGAPARRPLLVSVGRLSSEKRPDITVAAFELAVDRGLHAELVMVGDGPLRADLEARVDRRPIHFCGHLDGRPALAALLASSDLLVAPCPVETFGLSVLEALACGTPVLVPDHGAAQELLAPRCGRAVRADPEAFATAIVELLADGATSRIAARDRAAMFPWAVTVDRMLALHGVHPRPRPSLPSVPVPC